MSDIWPKKDRISHRKNRFPAIFGGDLATEEAGVVAIFQLVFRSRNNCSHPLRRWSATLTTRCGEGKREAPGAFPFMACDAISNCTMCHSGLHVIPPNS